MGALIDDFSSLYKHRLDRLADYAITYEGPGRLAIKQASRLYFDQGIVFARKMRRLAGEDTALVKSSCVQKFVISGVHVCKLSEYSIT